MTTRVVQARPPASRLEGRAVAWAPIIYLAATALGVAMRFAQVGWVMPLPFDHLLHAHSHALYFGWAGLVVLGAAGSLAPLTRPLWLVVALTPVMAVSFLAWGYAPASIAASTLMMLIWYWAVASWWRRARGLAAPAFRAAFAYVVLASLGVWVLAGLQATGRGDGLAADLAVHAFLSTFAWSFVLGTAGLVGPGVRRRRARRVIAWWAALAWVTFPLGVAGGPEVPWLGAAARLAALALLYPAWLWVSELWRAGEMRGEGMVLRGAAVWFAVKTIGEAAAAVGGTPVLEEAGRHGVVLYLHAALLGYVTTVLAWYLSRKAGTAVGGALAAHHVGVGVMLVGLLMAAWGIRVPVGLWAAGLGAGLVWLAGLAWAIPVWKGMRG